jgi:hypothetical protein
MGSTDIEVAMHNFCFNCVACNFVTATIKGPRPLAQCRFHAVQCRRCRHYALPVFKWKYVQYSRVVPVKFIIVSPLPEQATVLH